VLLENAYNFRDLGGLPTTDGRALRHGRLYRSDGLHRITEGDRAALASLGLRTVIDLRRPHDVGADRRMPARPGE
jgi:protein-tyrosine phosphatase